MKASDNGMVEIKLNWEGPFKISEIRKKFLEERLKNVINDPNYYWITWPGIYIFIDEKTRPLYVGSATKDCTNPLRARIREHLKGSTKFVSALREKGLDLDDGWQLIVAPFVNNEPFTDILKIERVLTHILVPHGNFEDFAILNFGRCKPIPAEIKVGLSWYTA